MSIVCVRLSKIDRVPGCFRGGRQWRPDQVWNIVTGIAASKSREISYDSTMLNVFKGDEVALQQLVSLDLISVTYQDGVPDKLRAGPSDAFFLQFRP
jgi:RNA12 protein